MWVDVFAYSLTNPAIWGTAHLFLTVFSWEENNYNFFDKSYLTSAAYVSNGAVAEFCGSEVETDLIFLGLRPATPAFETISHGCTMR